MTAPQDRPRCRPAVEARDRTAVSATLADDVVFHTPVRGTALLFELSYDDAAGIRARPPSRHHRPTT